MAKHRVTNEELREGIEIALQRIDRLEKKINKLIQTNDSKEKKQIRRTISGFFQ